MLISFMVLGVVVNASLFAAQPSFEPWANYQVGLEPDAVALSDIDGDNDIDMIIANMGSDNISVFKNGGNGDFGVPTNYDIGNGPSSIYAGDIDHDGDNDLAISLFASNSISIMINNGSGQFASGGGYTTGLYSYSLIGNDLDLDGDIDLATPSSSTSKLAILKNSDSGVFNDAMYFDVGAGPHDIKTFHLYRDSYPDLALICSGINSVYIVRNRRNGMINFTWIGSYATGNNPSSLCVADFDDDGDDDFLTANPGSDNMTLIRNNDDGTFHVVDSNFTAEGDPIAIIADDFNGDGKIDAAIANRYSNSFSVLENNGSGAFKYAVGFAAGSAPQAIGSADLDGDGDRDVVVVNNGGNNVSVFRNRLYDSTGLDDEGRSLVPGGIFLVQNYPNPFNPGTNIQFSLTNREEVSIEIYNILGEKVRELFHDMLTAGDHAILWDGRDGEGNEVSSGIYFCRLKAGSNSMAGKMILLR